jgi:hypothetical protein
VFEDGETETINEDLTIEKKIETDLNEKVETINETETMSAKHNLIYESESEDETEPVVETEDEEELAKKEYEAIMDLKRKAEEKLMKAKASKELPKLRGLWNAELETKINEKRKQIERIEAEIETIKLEQTATSAGANDELVMKLYVSKTQSVVYISDKPKTKKVASATGEKRAVVKVARPELNEFCGKTTTFKCVWAKGEEYVATYDPVKNRLTYNGNEYKNLNDWINGKEKVAGNSIADERGQKTSAKSAWKVSYVLNAKNEWVFCDTLVKGCERVI